MNVSSFSQSIFLQNAGACDSGAEGGERVPSVLQHISAIPTGQVKLPLYTGPALSRLALVLMVHLDTQFFYLIEFGSARYIGVFTGPAESLPSYSEPLRVSNESIAGTRAQSRSSRR